MKPVVLVLGPGPQPLRELMRYFTLIHLPAANPLLLAFPTSKVLETAAASLRVC